MRLRILNLFRPKWKSEDEDVRLKAVCRLKNQKNLMKIVLEDKSLRVQCAAIKNMYNISMLLQIIYAEHLSPYSAVYHSRPRFPYELRKLAVAQIRDEQALFSMAVPWDWDHGIVGRSKNSGEHFIVASKRGGFRGLLPYKYSDELDDAACFAAENIENIDLLHMIAMQNNIESTAERSAIAAIKKIADADLLMQLAQNAPLTQARAAAYRQLGDEKQAVRTLAYAGSTNSIIALNDRAEWQKLAESENAAIPAKIQAQELLYPEASAILKLVYKVLHRSVTADKSSLKDEYEDILEESMEAVKQIEDAARSNPEWIRPLWRALEAAAGPMEIQPTRYGYYYRGLGCEFPPYPFDE